MTSSFLIRAIRFYQDHLSGFKRGSCMYTPSCSNYSIDAIRKYGALKGLWLAVRRVSRCRTPYRGGYDPVR